MGRNKMRLGWQTIRFAYSMSCDSGSGRITDGKPVQYVLYPDSVPAGSGFGSGRIWILYSGRIRIRKNLSGSEAGTSLFEIKSFVCHFCTSNGQTHLVSVEKLRKS